MNPAITHCKHGHEFTPGNTITRKNGNRKCRECANLYLRQRRKRIGPKIQKALNRRFNLKFNYGLSSCDVIEMLLKQRWRCANPACGTEHTDINPLHIDHDHSCCPGRKSCGKCVRGLLCSPCNRTLGFVHDDAERLIGLVGYLETWKTSSVHCGSEMTLTTSL